MVWRKNIWTVANAVTAVKVPLAGVFPWATRGYELELLVLIAAAASDYLDGRIARRMGQAGGFGAILDPICDKIFLLTVVVTYLVQSRIPVWALAVVVMRDVYVLAWGAFLVLTKRWRRFTLEARFLGKVTTFLQFVFFGFVALELPSVPILAILFIVSVLACYDYTVALLDQARKGAAATLQPGAVV